MARDGVRISLEPLEEGPWLIDPSGVRFCGRLSLGTFVAACGLALMVTPFSKARESGNSVDTMLGLIVLLFLTAGIFFAATLAVGFSQGFLQYCPECLKSMTRGARVCPYCGFRETPCQEQP